MKFLQVVDCFTKQRLYINAHKVCVVKPADNNSSYVCTEEHMYEVEGLPEQILNKLEDADNEV